MNPKRLLEYYTRRILQIRLGLYQHYAPRALHFPAWYTQPITLTSLPTISIVTPAYQHGEFIERTIQSVLSQGYMKLEYIVQDGGSTDETTQILSRYQDQLTAFESKPDRGQTHALNLGFAKSSGDIMAYLNSDDVLLPGTINYVVKYFVDHPDVDVVYGHRICIDVQDRDIGRWILPPHSHRMLLWADYVPQETLFWRRRVWDKVGAQFDEHFQFAMDWDLLLRFYRAGAVMRRLPRFLGGFRVHSLQKSQAQLEGIGEREMTILRTREHGRVVSRSEIQRAIIGYLLRHTLYDQLYRYGLMKA